MLREERDIAKSLEDLFGNSEPSVHVDSDSITFKSGGISSFSVSANSSCGLGTVTPSTSLTLGPVKSNFDQWLDTTETGIAITSNKPRGKWVWERVIIESDSSPNPIRRRPPRRQPQASGSFGSRRRTERSVTLPHASRAIH